MHIKLKHIVLGTFALAFVVILLGAYTRLKDAGLGCPDWPGCYGKLLAPQASTEFSPTAVHKAWIEMIHRYVAGTLGILIAYIAWRTLRTNMILAIALFALVIFQALLGMWTVTLRLYPVVVLAHLLGGFAILSLLWLLYLNLAIAHKRQIVIPNSIKLGISLCLLILIAQIILGGWTSANYAALVCADFPTCQGSMWPLMDWGAAFNFYKAGIFTSPGVELANPARVTIQVAHRLGAVCTLLALCILSYALLVNKHKLSKFFAILILTLLSTQIILGIANVLAHLPLPVSIAHNAGAALLLLCLLALQYFTTSSKHDKHRHTR